MIFVTFFPFLSKWLLSDITKFTAYRKIFSDILSLDYDVLFYDLLRMGHGSSRSTTDPHQVWP